MLYMHVTYSTSARSASSSKKDDRDWHTLFGLDVGEPLEQCQELTNGLFTRRWTKGTARLDCRKYSAELPYAPSAI